MVRRLTQGEHRRHTRVGSFEDRCPLRTGTGQEAGGDRLAQPVPACEVLAGGGVGRDAEKAGELVVELRFQGADGHVLTVRRLVAAVERAAPVEQVHPASVLPAAGRHHAVDHGGQMRSAVHDRGVDHLARSSVRPRVLERGEDADDQIERTARVVAEQIGRDCGRLAGASDHAEGPGDGDVRDVVPGASGQRPFLPPAGHPSVHELGVTGVALRGADPEPLRYARPVPLDQDVRALHEAEDTGGPVVGLEVDEHRALVPVGEVVFGVDRERRAAGPVDPYDIGAEVREDHRGERAGPDPRQLDHPDSCQRTVRCLCHPAPSTVTQLM